MKKNENIEVETEIEKMTVIEKYKCLIEDVIDLDTRTIYLFGELNENLGTILHVKYAAIKLYWEQELRKPFSDINLNISSGGGSLYSTYAALDFYDLLKKRDNVLVNTESQGICMSAATILAAGGTGVRRASKRCKFMLHDIQIEGGGASTATQFKSAAKSLEEDQFEFFKMYVQIANKDKEMSDKELKKETAKWIKNFASSSIEHYLTSEKIKELNLIDEIY